jgi:hypothetical protein
MEDTKEKKPRPRKKRKLSYIARESMTELLKEANERGIQPESIVQIVVKGNTFNLVFSE